jgi:predicted DNA-binding protein (MmcQ/YjbR family)
MSSARTGGRSNKAPARPSKTKPRKKTSVAAKSKAKTASGRPPKRKPSAAPSADAALAKVRALCLALPDTKLTMTWGSPHFRVGEKIFCGFGSEDGRQVLGVKLTHEHARSVVKEARFWPAPYVGKHGWVSMDVTQRKSWDEVAQLIRESYDLIAPKASRAKLR